jgi:hypothetical protein
MAHKYAKVANKKVTKVTSKDFSRESYRLDQLIQNIRWKAFDESKLDRALPREHMTAVYAKAAHHSGFRAPKRRCCARASYVD